MSNHNYVHSSVPSYRRCSIFSKISWKGEFDVKNRFGKQLPFGTHTWKRSWTPRFYSRPALASLNIVSLKISGFSLADFKFLLYLYSRLPTYGILKPNLKPVRRKSFSFSFERGQSCLFPHVCEKCEGPHHRQICPREQQPGCLFKSNTTSKNV
jgi:hypothetical protein